VDSVDEARSVREVSERLRDVAVTTATNIEEGLSPRHVCLSVCLFRYCPYYLSTRIIFLLSAISDSDRKLTTDLHL